MYKFKNLFLFFQNFLRHFEGRLKEVSFIGTKKVPTFRGSAPMVSGYKLLHIFDADSAHSEDKSLLRAYRNIALNGIIQSILGNGSRSARCRRKKNGYTLLTKQRRRQLDAVVGKSGCHIARRLVVDSIVEDLHSTNKVRQRAENDILLRLRKVHTISRIQHIPIDNVNLAPFDLS